MHDQPSDARTRPAHLPLGPQDLETWRNTLVDMGKGAQLYALAMVYEESPPAAWQISQALEKTDPCAR